MRYFYVRITYYYLINNAHQLKLHMYKNTNNSVRLLFIIDKESPNNTRAHIILYCVR